MANEIEHIGDATASTTLKFIVGDTTGRRWNTNSAAWESFTVANIQHYDIALSENPAGSYRYFGSVPSGITDRRDLNIWVYDKSGNLAASDLPNFIASGVVHWSGSEVVDDVNEIVNALSGMDLEVNSPVLADGTVAVVKRDDYTGTRSLIFTVSNYEGPSLSGGAAYFRAMSTEDYNQGEGSAEITLSGTVDVSGSTITLTYELDAADTTGLTIVPEDDGVLNYQYQAGVVTTGSKNITLVKSAMTITRDVL